MDCVTPTSNRKEGPCIRCQEIKVLHAKGYCTSCYKGYGTPKKQCLECGKIKPHRGKGLCRVCYIRHFLPYIKDHNAKKMHNIEPETYKKITKTCAICGFNTIVELHHIDGNHKNSNSDNLIGLCPNHHKMAHILQYKEEIATIIREKNEKNSK
jgi:hypothetical protein